MKKTNIIAMYVLLVVVLTSCSLLEPNQNETTSVVSSPSATVLITTEAPALNQLFLTDVPTLTPTVTPIPVIRMPALEKEEAEEKVISLLADNGGCALPCFWGFEPDISKESDLISYKGMFDNIKDDAALINIVNGEETLSVSIESRAWRKSQPDIIEYILVRTNAFIQRENYKELLFATPDYKKYFKYYGLQNILENYGMPANSYLWIESYETMNIPDLLILDLDYSQYGFFISIMMPSGWDTDIGFRGCPQEGVTTLLLWEPGDPQGMLYLRGYYSLNHATFEKMTGIAPEEYFEMYLHSPDSCFEFEIPEMKE